VLAFNLIVELVRNPRGKNVIAIQDGLQFMSTSLHPPIVPDVSPPFEMSEHVRSRLSGDIGLWAEKREQEPTGQGVAKADGSLRWRGVLCEYAAGPS
jgi:hypothetical protein